MTRADKAALWAIIPLLAAGAAMHFLEGSYGGDKQWESVAARMLLEGKHLYRDIFEINPPLIYWIYALVQGVSDALGLAPYSRAPGAAGLLLAASSLGACVRVLSASPLF